MNIVLELFNRKQSRVLAKRPPPRIPEGTRVYAIGDIHGRHDLLCTLQDRILEDAEDHPGKTKAVIYLGDYVDRGPESREVVEHLSTKPLAGFNSIHLRGNHEQALLGFLREPLAYANWLMYGGLATLASHGVDASAIVSGTIESQKHLNQVARDLERAIPEHQRLFLERLEPYHVFGDYLFVHAGIRPEVPLEAQNPEDLLWIRDDFLNYGKPHPHFVIHGHNISDEPDIRDNRIGIDTGAFATGCLCCLVLDGEEQAFIDSV